MRIQTSSGTVYLFEDGLLTRLSESPLHSRSLRQPIVNFPAQVLYLVEGWDAQFSVTYPDGTVHTLDTTRVTSIEHSTEEA